MNTKSGVVYDARGLVEPDPEPPMTAVRSEEHTSELQSH